MKILDLFGWKWSFKPKTTKIGQFWPSHKNVYFFDLLESEKNWSEDEKNKGSFCTEPRPFYFAQGTSRHSSKEIFLTAGY